MKRKMPKTSILRPKPGSHWVPKGRRLWIVFDMSNGDVSTKRYCWWFDTRKAAREHIEWQASTYGARLSPPYKVTMEGDPS